MDIHIAFLTLGVCIGSAALLYFISIFGTQEKSYEQAIEEQKKRNQTESLQKSSLEKPKKEKKFKKWGRRSKDKSGLLETDQENDQREFHSSSFDRTDHSVENYEAQEMDQKPLKPKKRGRPLTVSKLTVTQRENEVGNSNNTVEASSGLAYANEEPVQKQNERVLKPISLLQQEELSKTMLATRNETNLNEKQLESMHYKQNEIPTCLENDMPVGVQIPASTPTKKKKKDHAERGVEILEITGDKLLSILKKTDLSDEESQVLIDVLLNKQKGAAEWTKKKDPVLTLKKQLQEKEQALEMEQKHTQSLNAKLKELRQELIQEVKKTGLVEQSLKVKLTQHQLEIQSLENRIKNVQEQHLIEKSTLQTTIQQIQNSVNEEQAKTISHLQEEKTQLQQTLAKLELEDKSKTEVEVSRLQQEMEQLHSTKDQYESRIVMMQQNQDELHQQNAHLENHIAELISTHTEQQNSLQKEASELTDKVVQMEEFIVSLQNELKSSHSACESLETKGSALHDKNKELEKQFLEKEMEIQRLKINLEDANKCSTELQCQVSQLNQQHTDQSMQLKNLQQDNDKLLAQVTSTSVRSEDCQEFHHQNGEFIDKNDVQKESVPVSLHERMLEEKEERIIHFSDEINKQKLEITSLTEEIELHKKKNNELREKNWKAMEAVSAVEKLAEDKIKQIQDEADKNFKKHLIEREKKNRDLQEELHQKLLAAENKIKEIHRNTEDRILLIQRQADEKEIHVKRSSEKRLQEINETSNQKLEEVQKLAMVLKEEINNVQENTRQTFQRIFPNIKIMSNLPYNEWLSQCEEKALIEINALKPADSDRSMEVKDLASKLTEAEKQKEQLNFQVKHYQTVLFKTESILNKLQSSVESEEQVWKDRLQAKEKELQNVLKEKVSLEANLHQLHELEELQRNLRDLQAKLQDEEMEKKQLEQKFDEVSKNVINLRDQIESKNKQTEELLKEKISADAAKKELDEVKTQLEKEKKITKDLSSQTVKLHTLVKTGQDALKAEQETVKQLRLELSKGSMKNDSPALTSVQENENGPDKQ